MMLLTAANGHFFADSIVGKPGGRVVAKSTALAFGMGPWRRSNHDDESASLPTFSTLVPATH